MDGSVDFSNGITAIIGGNGVGKSTIANAISAVLAHRRHVDASEARVPRLAGARIEGVLAANGNEILLSLAIGDDGRVASHEEQPDEYPVVYLDPSEFAVRCQHVINGDSNFGEVLESLGPRTFNKEELGDANYLVGKNYTACRVWEVHEYGSMPPFPYFEVSCNEVTYSSADMGRGELSLLLSLWSIKNLLPNSFLVLEEPENHVSARSQRALMNLVARVCRKSGVSVAVTTHAATIIENLPKEHVRLLSNVSGKSRLVSNPSKSQISNVVGEDSDARTLVIVEDKCAKHFVYSLCETLDEDLYRQISVVEVEGSSGIDSALSKMPRPSRWLFTIVGVYDGDMRRAARPTLNWPHLYLPTNIPPEELLQTAAVTDSGQHEIGVFLGIDEKAVHAALSEAKGLDPHDWLERVAIALGKSLPEVIRAMTRAWLSLNRSAGTDFVSELRMAIVGVEEMS